MHAKYRAYRCCTQYVESFLIDTSFYQIQLGL